MRKHLKIILQHFQILVFGYFVFNISFHYFSSDLSECLVIISLNNCLQKKYQGEVVPKAINSTNPKKAQDDLISRSLNTFSRT